MGGHGNFGKVREVSEAVGYSNERLYVHKRSWAEISVYWLVYVILRVLYWVTILFLSIKWVYYWALKKDPFLVKRNPSSIKQIRVSGWQSVNM